MKITAVVVTFNRLTLLKETINGLRNQTVPLNEIYVINNSSTDGTLEWLAEQNDIHVITQGNVGGSGGFFTGFKAAYISGADWIWGMDDDTIPMENALEKMLDKMQWFKKAEIAFFCSKAVWTDGTPHLMNLPEINVFSARQLPFSTFDQYNVLLVDGCSFVSILLNRDMIHQMGLPYKEFYIWYDDKEYTNRLTNAGYLGLYCPDSIALHKTPTNYRVDLYTDTPKNLWKYAYAIRNELFIFKRDRGFLYFLFYATAKLAYGIFKILTNRKTDRWAFCKVLIRSTFQAVSFNPVIDKV